MTCIVGIVHNNKVFIGGDSAAVGHHSIVARNDRKVFTNGDFVMGFTSSFRMGQLLAFGFNPPKPRVGDDIMAYMVGDFIDAARARMKAGGFAKVTNGEEEGGTFLVGYKGRLFVVHGDFQVGESSHGFDAVGCGQDIALGSLYSSNGETPRLRITRALKAAETFSAGVRAPFHIVDGAAADVAPSSRKRK